jgi:hypothetical protein
MKPTPAEVCAMLEIMLAHTEDQDEDPLTVFRDFVYRMVHITRDIRCSHPDWIAEFRTLQDHWLKVNLANPKTTLI